MQIIDPNKPYFVDTLQAPNTVAVPEKYHFTNFQNTKQYWSLQFQKGIGAPPFTFDLFTYESYRQFPIIYSKNILVNGQGIDSYQYLMNLVQNNAFKIWWIKISWQFTSVTDAQIRQPLFYNYIDANGLIKQDQLLGYEDLDPYQKNFSVLNIDLRDSSIILDQDRYLSYQFVQPLNDQGATFTFYYEQALQSDVLDEQKDLTNLLTEI